MANICSNELHIYTDKENIQYIKDFMNTEFQYPDFYYEEDQGDSYILECNFDSKWSFPEDTMNKLTKDLPNSDFNATCLSVEWGNLYCAFHSSDGDRWYYES